MYNVRSVSFIQTFYNNTDVLKSNVKHINCSKANDFIFMKNISNSYLHKFDKYDFVSDYEIQFIDYCLLA